MSRKKKIEPLTGEALVEKVKELDHLTKEQKSGTSQYDEVSQRPSRSKRN
jgi:hypothetical protein